VTTKTDLDDTAPAPAPLPSLGEQAAIGRIERALFGGDDRLVRVGRYEIRALLGSGAFGKVYRAHDPELKRDVALKIVEALAADRDELLREARVMATIAHPNVAPVHDAGILDTRVFLVMELVAGGDLRAWLKTPRPRSLVLDVLRQAGRGLEAAHAGGHRAPRLQADNVLVGDDGRARVVDFGLSRAGTGGATATPDASVELCVTVTAALAGTPAYMAPELWDAQPASALSDQFAFCVTAWEALCGERPFTGASVGELIEALGKPLRSPPRGALGNALGKALGKGLARVPAARHGSLAALIAALEPRRPRWIVPAVLAATAAIGTAIGGIVVATRGGAEAHPIQLPAIDPCPRPSDELVGVWDDPSRKSIELAFRATGTRGADTFTRVATALDHDAASWLDARVAACVATSVRHAQSPQVLDRRVACLRDWRRHFAALTGGLVHASADTVAHAPTSVTELPSLAHCADVDAMAAEPEVTAELQPKLDALLDKLALARAAVIIGKPQDAVDAAEQVANDPDAARYPPLETEAWLWLGQQLASAGRLDEARAAVAQGVRPRAIDRGQALGGDRGERRRVPRRVRPDAPRGRAAVAAHRPGAARAARRRIASSRRGSRTSRARWTSSRACRPRRSRRSRSRSRTTRSSIRITRRSARACRCSARRSSISGRSPTRSATCARRSRATSATLGDDHPEVASSEINLALVLAARGYYGDAIAMLDDALALQARVLGSDYGSLAYGSLARAEVNKSRGDRAAAAKDLEDARRRARAGYGPASALAAQAEMATAELEAELGHGAAAVEHAKAARNVMTDAISVALADATLARAMAASGDPAALALAKDAAARVGDQAPGAIRGLVYSAYGELALARRDPAAALALREAEGAFLGGSPSPWRLAKVRFSLAKALASGDRTAARAEAQLALEEFPRDGDPALKSAISKLVE